MNRRILIFGATSSVASDIARQSANAGDQLYLVGRSEQKLKALVNELGEAVVGHRCMSFDDAATNQQAVQQAFEELVQVDLALVAHGYLGDQILSEKAAEEAERSILVNYTSAVSLLIPLANKMENQGHGAIAAISSVAGDRGRPRNYTYGSAKAALTTYLQGLRSRLYPHVSVHTIKLGPVDTPMTIDHEKNASFTTSPEAAKGILQAIASGKREAYVPGFWFFVMGVVRRLPEPLFQRLKFLSGR